MMQYLRRYLIRIVAGVVLLAGLYFVVSVFITYRREQRIAAKWAEIDASTLFEFCGPEWIPPAFQSRLPFCSRIRHITMNSPQDRNSLTILFSELESLPDLESLLTFHTPIRDSELAHLKGMRNLKELYLLGAGTSDTGLDHLKSLTSLQYLSLRGATITDEGLKKLNSLTKLTGLRLDQTQITDTGLLHLRELKNLRVLRLDYAKTTSDGRAELRKSLPDCKIDPDP